MKKALVVGEKKKIRFGLVTRLGNKPKLNKLTQVYI